MTFLQLFKKQWRPKIQVWLDDRKLKKDKRFFQPYGTQVFCGRQGSGKTISSVVAVLRLKQRYPDAVIVSNLRLIDFKAYSPNMLKLTEAGIADLSFNAPDSYILFTQMEELTELLTKVNNGTFGVIYLIDEIHTYFNSLESKNIPMFVFTEISQQRKQRKVIIGTSQLFLRMAKPFREQCDNMVVCNTHMGIVTTQQFYDGMDLDQDSKGSLIGKRLKWTWFFHTRTIRNSFDTYQKVVSGAEQYDNSTPITVNFDKKMKLKTS